MSTPQPLPVIVDPAAIHDQLAIIRDHYTKALELAHADLPQSSAAEEIQATRKLNNLILDLSPRKLPIDHSSLLTSHLSK